jgi:hypothetical protein
MPMGDCMLKNLPGKAKKAENNKVKYNPKSGNRIHIRNIITPVKISINTSARGLMFFVK